jgi:putative addiction module antidote
MNKPFTPPHELKLIKVGNSVGVILPKQVLAKLGVTVGDSVSVVDTPEGLELRARDDRFSEQMTAAREVMARRRKALRELAK